MRKRTWGATSKSGINQSLNSPTGLQNVFYKTSAVLNRMQTADLVRPFWTHSENIPCCAVNGEWANACAIRDMNMSDVIYMYIQCMYVCRIGEHKVRDSSILYMSPTVVANRICQRNAKENDDKILEPFTV